FLDGGTTTLERARAIRARNDISVASNSIPIAVELANHPRLILTGGTVKESTLALAGPIAERSIEQMHVDIAFSGLNGVSDPAGAARTCPGRRVAPLTRAPPSAARGSTWRGAGLASGLRSSPWGLPGRTRRRRLSATSTRWASGRASSAPQARPG